MRRVLLDLLDFLEVVVSHQRLVGIEFSKGFLGLDGIGVDDLVPDEILPFLGRHVLDVLVDDQELGHGGHVEAGAGLVQRLDDRRIGLAFTA